MPEKTYRIFEILPQRLCFYEEVGFDLDFDQSHFFSLLPKLMRKRFSLLDLHETTIRPDHLYEVAHKITWQGRHSKWEKEKTLLAEAGVI